MKPLSEKGSVQFAIRVTPDLASEVEALEQQMAAASPYTRPTRADVLRAALERGVEALRKELGKPSRRRASR